MQLQCTNPSCNQPFIHLPTRGKKPSLCPVCRQEAKKINQRLYSRNYYSKYIKHLPERLLILSPLEDEEDNVDTNQPITKSRAPYRDNKPVFTDPTLRFDLAIKNKAKLLGMPEAWVRETWLFGQAGEEFMRSFPGMPGM